MNDTDRFSLKKDTLPWPDTITIVDVTPRDGLQDADRLITTEQKLQLIRDLIEAGVRHIEVTSFVHPAWVPQMADADQVAAGLPRHPEVTYSALVPNMRGYVRARASGISEVALVVSASEAHNRANLNRSIDATLAQLAEVAAQARTDGIALRGAISTSFGCPFEGSVPIAAVTRIAQAYAEMGVQQIAPADTIGVANPRQVYELFNHVRKELPSTVTLTAHFHDRQGYGLANVFAAIQAGITRFDTAVGGLGGCPYAPGAPGNLATEAVVDFLEQMGFATHISQEKLAQARTQLLEALSHGEPAISRHKS
jgi:hydroxymethylglutaryl-CoA lyase